MVTNVNTLDKTIQESNELLKDIETQFGWEGERELAYDALRSVIHTLRDRLTIDEAADFAAQLPILIKGVFYEGYKPSKMPVKMDSEEFLDEVRQKFPMSMDISTRELVQSVLRSLGRYVSQGEMKDVKDILPKQLSSVL